MVRDRLISCRFRAIIFHLRLPLIPRLAISLIDLISYGRSNLERELHWQMHMNAVLTFLVRLPEGGSLLLLGIGFITLSMTVRRVSASLRARMVKQASSSSFVVGYSPSHPPQPAHQTRA